MTEFFPTLPDHQRADDEHDDEILDESEIDPPVDWENRCGTRPGAMNVPADFEFVNFLEEDEEMSPAPEEKPAERKQEVPAVKKDAVTETRERDLVSQLPRESLDAVRRAMVALSKVKAGEAIPVAIREQLEQAIKDAAKIDPAFAAAQEEKLTEELRSKERKHANGMTLPPWTPEKEREYWEKKAAANKALVEVPEPTRGRVAALEVQRGATSDALGKTRIEQQIVAALTAERSPKAMTYLLARRSSEQFDRDNAMGIVRRNLHQQEMALLHSSQLCNALYVIAMERAGKVEDKRNIEDHLKKCAFDQFTVSNISDIDVLREKYKIKEADPLDAKIPGRAALKEALEIMRDEKQGTMKQRLEKAAPLYQRAIGASDEMDTKKLDDELKAIAKEVAEMGEGGNAKRREELGRKAVELLEAVRQPGIARFAYAQALNHTAVEEKDNKLNDRAVNLLKALVQKEPGYQYDSLVQGFLKLAAETPLKKISEEDAIKAGAPEVERLKKDHKENGGGPKPEQVPFWREALNFVAGTAAFMAAWWALGKVFSPVSAYGSHLRRQWEMSSRLKNLTTEPTADLKPGDKPQLFYRDKEGKDHPVEGVRKEDGTLRIKKDGKVEVVAHEGKLVLKVPAGAELTPEQAKAAAADVLKPTSQEHEIENARKEAEQHKTEAQKNLADAQKKQAENEQLQRTIEELEQRLKEAKGGAAPAEASEAGKAVLEKLPKRLRDKLPTEYNPDVKESMERALEANRDKWPEKERKNFEKLIADYEKQDGKAIEEVNKMLRESSAAGEGRPGEGGRAGGTGGEGGRTGGTEGGRTGGDVARTGGEGAPMHRTGPEHHSVDPKPPAERLQAQAIETLTSKDGIKYIESIPIGELTVAKVEQKMKDIDKEIKAAKEKGLHDYASELEKMKDEYHKQTTAKDKQAYCERAVEKVKDAHQQAKGAKEGGGRGLAGKAGTVVAVLMVAGWLLDVTAPAAGSESGGRRVLPGKR